MNGWIKALLILAGISVYIGIAALFYLALVKLKWSDGEADEDTATFAACWVVTLPFILILTPIWLYIKIVGWIDKENEK